MESINLFNLVYYLVEEVERMKENESNSEFIAEKAEHIIQHSMTKYNNGILLLKSFSLIGIQDGKKFNITIPTYLVFKVSNDYQKWRLSTPQKLSDVEWVIKQADDESTVVVLLNGEIERYTYIDDIITWKTPIYILNWRDKETGKYKQEHTHNKEHLEENIKRKVYVNDYTEMNVYNIIEQKYLPFYVTGTLYSTEGLDDDLNVIWKPTQEYDFENLNRYENIEDFEEVIPF